MSIYFITAAVAWVSGGIFFLHCLANDAAAKGNLEVGDFLAAVRRFEPAAITVGVAFMVFWPAVYVGAHFARRRA